MKSLCWSALFLALAALPLAAQGRGQGPRAERMAQALKLSDAQKTSIQAVRVQHHQALVLRRDAVKQAQLALHAAVMEATTPEAQLRALFDKAAAARFEMMLARRTIHQEVQALLTPEQQAQAAELRGRAQGRMHERRRHLHQGFNGMGMAG